VTTTRRAPPAPAKKRCAIYTRKSTTHGLDMEFSSLDAQWEACATYVRAHPDWELVAERYDDGGFSGANLERPAFQRLMDDVTEGRVDVVVVYKIDRLSRSLLDFAKLMERFRQAGAFFVSVTQPFLSADSDAMAQLLLNILMAFSQFERQMIAERIRDKMTASRRRGLWTGGNVPFGYEVADRKLVPHPTECEVVRRMVALYADTHSDAAVAHALDATGTRARTGRRWTPHAVARVLMNPVYAGYTTLGEELHEGTHAPIIARELFQSVQAARAAGPARRAATRNPHYLLRGLAFCACEHEDGKPCGYALTPASTHKGRKEYRYYRCIARDKRGPGSCPSKQIAAKALEAHVLERIAEVAREVAAGPELASRVHERTAAQRDELHRERMGLRTRTNALEAELLVLTAQAEAAAAAGTTDATTREILTSRRDAKHNDLARLKTRLGAAEEKLGALETLALDARWIAEQLQGFDQVWERLHPTNRLRLVRAVVRRVDVDQAVGSTNIELQPWCEAMLEERATLDRGAA
jgi:DNA invertase Pin-like site-specific DNA recombinase